MESSDESLLEIHDLRVYYRSSRGLLKAVDGVSLKINKKDVVGLLGESGCGKSTVALSIPRLLPSSAEIIGGKIFFNNTDLLELSEIDMNKIRGKHMTMIFQDPTSYLNPVMKVKDQLVEMISDKVKDKRESAETVVKQLEMTGIPSPADVARCYPHELSGGMAQRVLISMAFLPRPQLVIADEPTTALDVTIQLQILNLIKDMIKKAGSTFLLITHDLGIAADLCDKIYVMYAGKIVESASVYDIYEKPYHPYTEGLIQSTLSVDEFREHLVTIKGTVPDLVSPPLGCRFSPRCRSATDVCVKQEPVSVEVESGHFVSCHLYC